MDQKLLFLINREWTGPVLDRVMAAVSSAALWKVPIVLLVLAVIVRGGFRARAFVVVVLAAVLLCDAISGGIKTVAGRPRPAQTMAGVRQISLTYPPIFGMFLPVEEQISHGVPTLESGGRSFPSNHAANTACAALLASMFFSRRGWLAFFPALLVAYSRVYTGSHWPSDVLGGILLGFCFAAFTLLLAEMFWRRFGARLSPALAARFPSLLSPAA